MSDEGGLEEAEESLRAEASCACNWATVAVRASRRACRAVSCACNRSQLAQGVVASAAMRPYSIPFPPRGTTRGSSQALSGSRMMIGAPWPATPVVQLARKVPAPVRVEVPLPDLLALLRLDLVRVGDGRHFRLRREPPHLVVFLPPGFGKRLDLRFLRL